MKQPTKNTEQLKKEFEEKVIRYLTGLVAQYGKPYEELTELQKHTMQEDITKTARGIIYETIQQTKATPHLISSDEIKREAYKNCIRIIKAQTVIRTDLGEVATKELVNIETLGRNIVGAIENQYLTQSKEDRKRCPVCELKAGGTILVEDVLKPHCPNCGRDLLKRVDTQSKEGGE